MNIAIDLQPLYSWHRSRGIGNSVKCQVQSILDQDTKNQYYLLNFYGNIPVSEKLVCGDNIHELNIYEKCKPYLSQHSTVESKRFFKTLIRKIIHNYKIDVFHMMAAVDEYDIYDGSFFRDVKLITTVYDLIPVVFANMYLKDINYLEKYIRGLEQYLYADYTLSVSRHTKSDLMKYLGVPSDLIKPIMSGIDPRIKKVHYSDYEKKIICTKYKINSPYLFFAGADDFRKNLINTTTAFCSIEKDLIDKYQLVIVCSISDKSRQELIDISRKYHAEGRVIVTGYVSDEELLCLLNNAHVALFPALYEGFGLPVAEAWTCGIPVITSNNSSLGEIAKDAAIIVNPFSAKSITGGIKKALCEKDLEKYIERGYKKLEKYNWYNAAKDTIIAYEEVYIKEKIHISPLRYWIKKKRLISKCYAHIPILKRCYYGLTHALGKRK